MYVGTYVLCFQIVKSHRLDMPAQSTVNQNKPKKGLHYPRNSFILETLPSTERASPILLLITPRISCTVHLLSCTLLSL